MPWPTPCWKLYPISSCWCGATVLALYTFKLRAGWRAVFAVGATLSLYFNVFVLVAQAFQKMPSLHVLAPNGSEPPFAVAQGVVLLAFIAIGVMATRRFRPVGVFIGGSRAGA